jgi:alpha-glucuronidase
MRDDAQLALKPIARPEPATGYRLWLRYDEMEDRRLLGEYRRITRRIYFPAPSPALRAARDELARGLEGLLGAKSRFLDPGEEKKASLLVLGPELAAAIDPEALTEELEGLGREGYLIGQRSIAGRKRRVLAGGGEAGILYAVFRFLRQAQEGLEPDGLETSSRPAVAFRMLDHWDNLDGTVERGYAGFSIWDWHRLPGYLPERYRDYARANASIGINAVALTNVNADALVLSAEYLEKAAALAGVFRAYGIRVFLTARFSAPIEIGCLPTADPLEGAVADWWKAKADEIYRAMPDFGGFLVKANSEGQPGPQDYGRSHADGANLLAAALAPHGGKLIWRAFVYSAESAEDRAKQAFEEFAPLDGAFLPNVMVQVKNGPIDFQPREPFHPLFGAMPRTPLALEFQITQEYLGFASHLAYLGPLFEEVLRADTLSAGPGSTVARVVDGSLGGHALSCVAGVSNIGASLDWCGSHFAQANWYAFGRMAWDPGLGAREIAEEWVRSTFTRRADAVESIVAMMMGSREAVVDYMTPLGLVHIMGWDHHYGPGPWISEGRPDWTSVYFHRADAGGIGFERGSGGSDAVAQYAPPLRSLYGDPESCPEKLILFFHRLSWDRPMRSGRSLWDELCLAYQRGVGTVVRMRATWEGLAGSVDAARFEEVRELLGIQEEEARLWKDACLAYFQEFSKRPYPEGVKPPERELAYYRSLKPRYVPGIGRIKP